MDKHRFSPAALFGCFALACALTALNFDAGGRLVLLALLASVAANGFYVFHQRSLLTASSPPYERKSTFLRCLLPTLAMVIASGTLVVKLGVISSHL